VQLQSAIGDAFGLLVPATVAFDYPTLGALGANLAAQLDPAPPALGAHLQVETAAQPAAVTASALVALSCRYPGGGEGGVPSFVDAIGAGRDLQSEVPSSRWDADAWYHPSNAPRRMYVRFGCWLEGIEQFDPAAFRVSSRCAAPSGENSLGRPLH
jgi:acyl transferase domain-containing protein